MKRPFADQISPPRHDPLIAGVLNRLLPAVGEPFPANEREVLLRALRANFDVLYGPVDADDNEGLGGDTGGGETGE